MTTSKNSKLGSKKKDPKSVNQSVNNLQSMHSKVSEGIEIRELHQSLVLIDCSAGQKVVRECINT